MSTAEVIPPPSLTLWQRLSEPFAEDQVRWRMQGGTRLHYITARSVMNRLDEVLGPKNWAFSYEIKEKIDASKGLTVVAEGTLTVTVSGETKTVRDLGGETHFDPLIAYKGAVSDALKRAAVQIGVGRHLYGDGVPDFEAHEVAETPQQPRQEPQKQHPPRNQGKRVNLDAVAGEDFTRYQSVTNELCQSLNKRLQDYVTIDGEIPVDWKEPANIFRLNNHLYPLGVKRGLFTDAEDKKTKYRSVVAWWRQHYPSWEEEIQEWENKLVAEVREKHRLAQLGDGIGHE